MSNSKARRGVARVLIGFALAGVLAACDRGPSQPAPVLMKGQADAGWRGSPPGYSPPPRRYSPPPVAYAPLRPMPPIASMPPTASAPAGPPPSAPPGHIVVVERGQSLGGIAARFHASERAIIDANHLQPPYGIETGARLVIPGGEGPPTQQAGLPTTPLSPSPARERDVIPLDGPPPPAAAATLTPPAAASLPPPPPPAGERSVADEARAEAAASASGAPSSLAPAPLASAASGPPSPRGGRFPWPVRGSIVAGYGGAAKNDGINIAAPLGTPVRAIEGGEVAYAGNELKDYGNLVLIKHADGWISAYAHCQALLVKKGERVSAGQVIAKVGTTGGVGRPQLHFELRRGQRPVDPREFLAPAPSAGKPAGTG